MMLATCLSIEHWRATSMSLAFCRSRTFADNRVETVFKHAKAAVVALGERFYERIARTKASHPGFGTRSPSSLGSGVRFDFPAVQFESDRPQGAPGAKLPQRLPLFMIFHEQRASERQRVERYPGSEFTASRNE